MSTWHRSNNRRISTIALINNPPRFGDHQWMWLITAGGTEYDALLLAEDAMKDWESCLVGHGLVKPEIGV
jgi:hypothetical protein